MLGDYPPLDPAGFEAFAAEACFPDVAEAIVGAEPLDDPVGFRFPASVRYRYERLRRSPPGCWCSGMQCAGSIPFTGRV